MRTITLDSLPMDLYKYVMISINDPENDNLTITRCFAIHIHRATPTCQLYNFEAVFRNETHKYDWLLGMIHLMPTNYICNIHSSLYWFFREQQVPDNIEILVNRILRESREYLQLRFEIE